VAEGLDIDQGTLYPLLRRLEEQGLLESVWELEEASPRRYYRLSVDGRKLLQELTLEWGKTFPGS
jgi:PadR family transcriptional regulator, regulatory protein PadR